METTGGIMNKLYGDYNFITCIDNRLGKTVQATVDNTKVWPEGHDWWGKETEMPSAMRARLREANKRGEVVKI